MRLTKKAQRLLLSRIRKRMKDDDLSTTEMAAAIGVCERTLRYWLDETHTPGPLARGRIEAALDVPARP